MRAVYGLIFATALWGQPAFQNLAPNRDGSVVFFSSPLRMKGTDQFPSQPKIFAWDQKHGVKLYRQKPPTIDYFVDGWSSRTAYNLVAPSISSDGRTIAITGLADCTFGSVCATYVSRYQAEIETNGGPRLVMPGFAKVSPNGRFVALGSAIAFPYPLDSPELTLLDLSTGQQQHLVNSYGFPLHHAIANDGTAIIDDPAQPSPQLRRWNGTTMPLNIDRIASPEIDASGRRVFYQAFDNTALSHIDLMVLDVSSGAVSKLASVDWAPADPPSPAHIPADISDDGSLTAFVRSGQAWTVRTDGTASLQVTNIEGKIVEVALSGSGSHLFAITDVSRLLRINLSTMELEEIIPATPIAKGLGLTSRILSPGGLAEAVSSQPIPEIQSVSLFGHDLAIVSATPASLQLQAPYDLPDGTGWPVAVLKQQSDGPFESAMLWFAPVEVASDAPAWYAAGNYVAASHQDFSAQITPGNPARPGEIVHAYGTGFGPVVPLPALGQAASANPLSRTTTPLVCGIESDDAKLVLGNILFSGLAPGFVALYQFDIQLPARPAGVDTYLVCGGPKDIPAGNYAGGLLPMAEK